MFVVGGRLLSGVVMLNFRWRHLLIKAHGANWRIKYFTLQMVTSK